MELGWAGAIMEAGAIMGAPTMSLLSVTQTRLNFISTLRQQWLSTSVGILVGVWPGVSKRFKSDDIPTTMQELFEMGQGLEF